ncbi:MAG: PEP-CTERM sorting domain-containing protein [Pirellulales bacterium]
MKLTPIRSLAILMTWGLGMALCQAALGGAINIPVTATVGGVPNVQIGNINASMSGNGSKANPFEESGDFTFTAPHGQLDNCYDFRWYQIIVDAPEDLLAIPEFKFKDPGGAYTVTPTTPFVDPPAGGYSYQSGDGGADNDPFYENTGPGSFAFPNFSDLHVEGVSSHTEDSPTPEDVFFETYLVVTGGDLDANEFCVLAGYSWNTVLEAGELEFPDPVQITPIQIAHLQTALENSGFSDNYGNPWTVHTDCDLMPCPEPATWLMLALGGAAALVVGRRRRTA